LKIAQATFPVPPFVTQAELVNILRLRSQIHALTMELQEADSTIGEKLNVEATVEAGPYTCANVNLRLMIWEYEEFCDPVVFKHGIARKVEA